MKVSILGCGWFGEPLGKAIKTQGHEVHGSTRSLDKKNELEKYDFSIEILNYPKLPSKDLLSSDFIILNIPPREEHLSWFKSWPWEKRSKIIFISSTSGRDILLEQEEWIKSFFPNWLILRFGGLVGPKRNPGRFLAGRKDLPGKLWPVNLIHLVDAIGFTMKAMELNLKHEVIHVVSDEAHNREEFYTNASELLSLEKPYFDQNDLSNREKISNERLKSLYELKWPTIFGKSL